MMNMNGEAVGNNTLLGGAGAKRATEADAAAAAATEVRTGQGMAGLLALQHDWAALAATRPDPRFQHLFEWHLCYLRNLERDATAVHFFSFFRDGRPIAIFPLRRTRRNVAGIPLWLWELPSNPHMNLCDCLVAHQEDGAASIRLLVDTLKRRKDLPWDALHLPNLIDDASALTALRAAAPSRTLLARSGRSMYFRCDDFESAMRNSTAQFKRNLRRQRKKLDQRGRVEVALVQDRSALDQAFAAFLQVEASGWKGQGGRGSAIVLHPKLVQFYRDLMEHFAADERCLISLLKLDDRVIAAQFCVIAGTTLYLLKIAYDETFSAEAPGSQLLHEVLKHCCDSETITRLSLVTGPAWAAGRWNPDGHDVWDVYAFNASLRGLAAYAAKRFRCAVAVVAKAQAGWRAGSGRKPAPCVGTA